MQLSYTWLYIYKYSSNILYEVTEKSVIFEIWEVLDDFGKGIVELLQLYTHGHMPCFAEKLYKWIL